LGSCVVFGNSPHIDRLFVSLFFVLLLTRGQPQGLPLRQTESTVRSFYRINEPDGKKLEHRVIPILIPLAKMGMVQKRVTYSSALVLGYLPGVIEGLNSLVPRWRGLGGGISSLLNHARTTQLY